MKFSTRLLLSAVVPAVLFTAALGASLFGLFRTERDFARLTSVEQKIATGFSEMYAQGLQMGQALRNIILDPANAKAYENLKAARESYDKAYAELAEVTTQTPFETHLKGLAVPRNAQAAAQEEVLGLAKQDQKAAIEVLNAKETPAWRTLRAALLKHGEEARRVAADAHSATTEAASRSKNIAIALAGFAALAAAGFLMLSRRTVRHELGCEPALAKTVLRRIASGDLSIDIDRSTNPQSLLAELAGMQDALRGLVGNVRESSENILVASSEVAVGSADLSSRTEQAASNLQETAASMEQMTHSVKQSAESASTANQLASSAADVAQRGGAVVNDVVKTMGEISESSRRIGDIIGVIDGIAFQTNILALNAAVEAARAGEQGRGFAVVAGEVRTLAQRSAEAAKEIKALINSSVEKVQSGTALVGHAGSTMTEILGSVQRVTHIIEEMSAASNEQSTGIQQIGAAVGNLDAMTQQNAALVEESAAAAESLKEQARSLAQVVSAFRLQPAAA